MVVDFRNIDRSCKNVPNKDSVYYQCLTCYKSNVFSICEECKINGDHEGHQFNEIKEAEALRMCDCGNNLGFYTCKNHVKCLEPNVFPIIYNQKTLEEIVGKFELSGMKCIELCRLNQIRKLDLKSAEGIIIHNYFYNTNPHNRNLHIKQCWSVYRKDQEHNFIEKGFDKTRRMLLWHGTKKDNLYGILSTGFRKPESDGVKNGAMFGRGIYFADRMSKSAQYCDENGYGILLLCEVALGSMWRTGLPKDYGKLPKGFQSIKGLGKKIPDKDEEKELAGILVPSGDTVDNPHPKSKYSHLNYNEYIVFNPERVLVKFIIAF